MTSSTERPTAVTPGTLRAWALPAPGEDKEARGRLLVAGGTSRTPGAVRLAGEAALRAGAGKLRLATVGSVTAALGVAVPEAATVPLPETSDGPVATAASELLAHDAGAPDAVLVGSGFT
ncbi:MAG: NAD(P)H-hydrate dehydratase, partial [Marmoricola sp.]